MQPTGLHTGKDKDIVKSPCTCIHTVYTHAFRYNIIIMLYTCILYESVHVDRCWEMQDRMC